MDAVSQRVGKMSFCCDVTFPIQERKEVPSSPSVPQIDLDFHLTWVIKLLLVRLEV